MSNTISNEWTATGYPGNTLECFLKWYYDLYVVEIAYTSQRNPDVRDESYYVVMSHTDFGKLAQMFSAERASIEAMLAAYGHNETWSSYSFSLKWASEEMLIAGAKFVSEFGK